MTLLSRLPKRAWVPLLVCSALGCLSLPTQAQTTQTVHFAYGDTVRSYYLRVPPSADSAHRVPLVIDLHGYTNSALGQAQMSGFRRRGDLDSFAVAWPQGIGHSWNAGKTCCGTSRERQLDDVRFIKTVVRHIRAAHPIDGARVYVTGHSNGGAMAERLAAEAGDVFAAAVDFSGFLDINSLPDVDSTRLAPILHVHGLQDSTVLYAGNAVREHAESTLVRWKSAQQCQGEPDTLVLHEATKSLCLTYNRCADSSHVSLCAIAGDHMIYNNTPRIDLIPMAWEFMKQFRLENPEEVTRLRRPPATRPKNQSRVSRQMPGGTSRFKKPRSTDHRHMLGRIPVSP
jgi:polyhydroxybutyrate depolymerase